MLKLCMNTTLAQLQTIGLFITKMDTPNHCRTIIQTTYWRFPKYGIGIIFHTCLKDSMSQKQL